MGRSRFFYDILMRLWPLGKAIYWLGNRPVIGRLLWPLFGETGNEALIVPVEETIHGADSVVLPYSLLNTLVRRSSARVLMNECMCRRGENCQTYPHDLGCLFLGDGATGIAPRMGRPVEPGEALAHVQRAMEIGLVPLIVHTAFDAWTLGVPYRRLLGICFCCDCCCTVRQGLRLGPQAFWDIVVRLPGLTVEVGSECVGCGACMDRCYVQAIALSNGRVSIDLERCKGCGRCIAACPTGAITLQMDESTDTLRQLVARIERRTDIGMASDSEAEH